MVEKKDLLGSTKFCSDFENYIRSIPNYERLRHCIASNPLQIFSSNDFLSLDMDTLFNLLKRNDLKIKESIIWDSLIKWGINQIPELKNIINNRDTVSGPIRIMRI